MEHTHIVQAADLDRYASVRDSQAVIPELIYFLVKQSCPNLIICRIPYGDAVNQPGWDGAVETDEGFQEFVPKGISYWEIGTGTNPQEKATKDFNKRTKEIDNEKRANSSFIFVTPRSSWAEPQQTKWLKNNRNTGWKQVRIIDGVKLADWLRECPAIGKWMAKKIGLTTNPGGLSTATEHWENLVWKFTNNDYPPPLPKLFTVGRSNACESLQKLFEGEMKTFKLFAESQQDVENFVSAFLAGLDSDISRTYSNRCLFINDEQAWRSMVETRVSHILIADIRLGLETENGAELLTLAHRKNHAVVIPLSSAWSGNSPEILRLRNPSQSQIETVLKESGYTDTQAKELSKIGDNYISALLRHLQGITLPPYATWNNARLMAQAMLVGKWDGSNPTDRSALESLLGKQYGEWIEILRPDTFRSGTPLIQRNEKWRLVARGEAWHSLGEYITDDDLDRFKNTVISVLGERDPKFDLPKKDRLFANIHGKVLTHSHLIRDGMAETLALIGSRPEALVSCSDRKAESTAVLVVRELLSKASWDRWASLDPVMPLLAEAAPDEFLDAVESVLQDLNDTPFHKIFTEEGDGELCGWNYMSGLLWALETLAWSPTFISQVSIILADIASFDPGGNMSNRPSNSLVDIFLPWHIQTTAPFEKRKSVVETVINEQPTVGWKFLLALLPHSYGMTTGCRRPAWRDFIPRDWKDEVLMTEYWEQVTAYIDFAISLAKSDVGKLCELVKRLPDLPKSIHESILQHLTSDVVLLLPEEDRFPIWENLYRLARHHRNFSDANWALSEDEVNKIEEVAQSIAPTSPTLKYHHLFDSKAFDLYDGKGNYDEQKKKLDEARQAAILEIIGDGNIDIALKFAADVTISYEVGETLGQIASNEMEDSMLPSLLDSEEDSLKRVVTGFVWARFWARKTDWVEAVLKRAWSPEHKAKFLTLLPFKDEIWKLSSKYLPPPHEALYWKSVKVNPYYPDNGLLVAIEKLLEYKREGAAVMCIANTVIGQDKPSFDESLATRALLAVLKNESAIKELNSYKTIELIKHLQKSETIDKNDLFQIEWNFLPWLGTYSYGSPVTLKKQLASDPAFFAEVIGLVFRSKNTDEDDHEKFDEQKKNFVRNAYKLLNEWNHCPGIQDDGSFNVEAFNAWIDKARSLTEESGHAEIAQKLIGQVLTYAPPDPDGLWIHCAVAEVLNLRNMDNMRSAFTIQILNNRGVYGFTHREKKRKLASENQKKAEELNSKGYTRFATAIRRFVAEKYQRDAEREAKRDSFENFS